MTEDTYGSEQHVSKLAFRILFFAKQPIYILLEIRFPRNLTEILGLTSLNYKNQEI